MTAILKINTVISLEVHELWMPCSFSNGNIYKMAVAFDFWSTSVLAYCSFVDKFVYYLSKSSKEYTAR